MAQAKEGVTGHRRRRWGEHMDGSSVNFSSDRIGAVDPISAVKAVGQTSLNFNVTARVGLVGDASKRLRSLELDASNPALAKARLRSDARALAQKLASKVEKPLFEGWRDAMSNIAALSQKREGSLSEADLNQVAEAVGALAGELQVAAGNKGIIREDALAQDLKEAVSAQFKPGAAGGNATLADLGFSLNEAGDVEVDTAKLKAAFAPQSGGATTQADQVANNVFLLASAGSKAIIDALNQAPTEQRLAEQNVRARADVSRLQGRQRQLLVFEAFVDNQRQRMKVMAERLAQEKKQQAEDSPKVLGASAPSARPSGPAGPLNVGLFEGLQSSPLSRGTAASS